jgi:hypothetical protein
MDQLIGWCGNIAFILGAYAMTQRRPIRYAVFSAVGNICYISQSVMYQNWSLLALSLILGTLNIVTLVRWK